MSIVLGQKKGLWHGLLHVRTAGIDLMVTHLSPKAAASTETIIKIRLSINNCV